MEICRKRIAEGFFLYALVELKQRWNIEGPINPDIDLSLEKYLPKLKVDFGKVWAEHRCEKPGCGWCVIGDGGLKAHRSLCAAVTSGVKEFPNSGVKILTGCPRYPGSGLFCSTHKDHVSPALHHKQLEQKNVRALNEDKKDRQHAAELDGVFVIDEILEEKNGSYHIKWKGYTATTWEPSDHVPKFIRDYYKKTGQSKLPKPRIIDTRVMGIF